VPGRTVSLPFIKALVLWDRWAATGWERGPLGYPVSNEYDVPGGKRNDFQRGSIVWDARTGATTVS